MADSSVRSTVAKLAAMKVLQLAGRKEDNWAGKMVSKPAGDLVVLMVPHWGLHLVVELVEMLAVGLIEKMVSKTACNSA